MAAFLASYAAVKYDMNRLGEIPAGQDIHPVEDAATLANEAWEQLSQFMTK
jgi:hypothetical protein